MSVETQDPLSARNTKDTEILFPHLNPTNTKTDILNKHTEKANDNITFIYTSKFSNLCDTKPDPKPKKQKPKQQKQQPPFHSQKRSCRLPGAPTFEDFFGENASHTSRYIPPHLCKRLNAIVIRKTENYDTAPTDINVQPEQKPTQHVTEPLIQSQSLTTTTTTTTKVKEMQAFLGKHFPRTTKPTTYNSARRSINTYDKPLSKLKSPLTKEPKCKYVQEINPHVNMYDDIRLLDKSTSCQRIDHLNRLMNLQFKYPNSGSSSSSNYLYTTNNKHNSVNDLFRVTRENRIKHKINDLMKFTIFPNYHIRKIDIDLKRQYAKNNLNIIGGIQEQFEENKKSEMKQTHNNNNNNNNNDNTSSHHSLDEDIEIDNLL